MRISDWSSDVGSSDLRRQSGRGRGRRTHGAARDPWSGRGGEGSGRGLPPTDRPQPCGGGSMIATMTSEWRKITTTKMWWLLALVMFAYMAFLGAVLGFSLTQSTAPTGPGMGGGGVPSGLESAQATYTVGASLDRKSTRLNSSH